MSTTNDERVLGIMAAIIWTRTSNENARGARLQYAARTACSLLDAVQREELTDRIIGEGKNAKSTNNSNVR